MDEKFKELNLLLLYLSGWEEDSKKDPGEKIYMTWKGYPFKILNEMEEEDLIVQFRNKQLLILTEKGIEEAKKIKDTYSNLLS